MLQQLLEELWPQVLVLAPLVLVGERAGSEAPESILLEVEAVAEAGTLAPGVEGVLGLAAELGHTWVAAVVAAQVVGVVEPEVGAEGEAEAPIPEGAG